MPKSPTSIKRNSRSRLAVGLDVSVIVPVRNEVDTVQELSDRVAKVLKKSRKSFEIIFIDDGSSDGTWDKLIRLSQKKLNIRALKFRRNFGKSAALMAGFQVATGKIIVTMDGDLQDDPDEIPHFLKTLDQGYDVVGGWKKTRHDPIHKVVPSRMMNWLAGRLTGARVHDMNCGFKAYRREAALDLDLYGDLYRFIPAFVVSRGWRLTEIPVAHHPRTHGKSKY